ncbi:DUF938 domain-containing protein [Croceicoccus sp. F390]|uniref:DUF938 domain-containing protein n=1 Tax=Croceicoccus esteveae TaxID=3075597 RepID=A0ABU2ZHF1_9SPHN|nr:DUF938 domain-containing protein [Croceicoccus sp. F390]MDT0575024.1 DUF938 domain-containing protein [Croceicoccus sp. F390]
MVEQDARQHAPATMRNREPIAECLLRLLPARGTVLEIASGTGEHARYFASCFPHLEWQPTDSDPAALASIAAWREADPIGNVHPPMVLDASAPDWKVGWAEAILCINMLHISAWTATSGLFCGAERSLQAGQPLIIYGPFLEQDVTTAASNISFDQALRGRDPGWGLRDLSHVDATAKQHGFRRTERVEMPANNLLLVYRR